MESREFKVYISTPKFITRIKERIRKLRLGVYKKKKVNQSKTPHPRMHYMTFKIHVTDNINPQISSSEYQMAVPARAAFFAKMFLEKTIKEKIAVEIVKLEEMTEEEYEEFMNSQQEFIEQKKIISKD